MDLSRRAFEEYHRRSATLDAPADEKQRWFDALVETEYAPRLPADRAAMILEIGCSRGYLLRALQELGYTNLAGVDMSPDDLRIAVDRTGLNTLTCGSAATVLQDNPGRFDCIILKAVLEHVRKEDVGSLLTNVVNALRPGGTVICEVPNMDWYAAPHERFMDLTHETGYTRESLDQVFSLFFREVETVAVTDPVHGVLAPRRQLFIRRHVLRAIRYSLRLIGEQTADYSFDCRSIMAVARSPRPLREA